MNVNYVNYQADDLSMADFAKTVTQPYICGLLQGAVLSGYKAEDLLIKAGLPETLLEDPRATIDGEALLRLLQTIEYVTGDYFLGFLEQPGKMALIIEQVKSRGQSSTLGELVRLSTQFREAVRNDVHYEYLMDADEHEFTMTVEYQLREGVDAHVFYWHRLMLIYRFWSWSIGKRIKLNRVCFASPKPAYYQDYQPLFNCEVLFDQAHNAISFDKRYLLNAVIRSEKEAPDFVLKHPNWLNVPGYDRSWSRQVEDVLVRLQREQDLWSPTINQVAEILAVSPRTLRRQLANEHEHFQGLKSRVRSELAIRLLLTTDTPVTVVANLVGYAEPGVFTRAFIGWTDMTPTAYREAHQSQAPSFHTADKQASGNPD